MRTYHLRRHPRSVAMAPRGPRRGYGGAIPFGIGDLQDLSGYDLAGLDGFFSKIFRKVKKHVKRIGKQLKPMLKQVAPALNAIPVLGPVLAPIASAVASGSIDPGALIGQVGGANAERIFRELYGHVGNWRGVFEEFKRTGSVPQTVQVSVATSGTTGPTPKPTYRPSYSDPSRRMQPWQGRMVDTCSNWGVWTYTGDIQRAFREGRNVRTPTGGVVSSKAQWDAARQAAVQAAPGSTRSEKQYNAVRGSWCPAVRPGSQARPAAPTPTQQGPQRAPTTTPQQYPQAIGPRPAGAGGMPNWVLPVAIAGGLVLLMRR